jgi:non-canonical poly(A) RNA polymerase PAPD5/7
MYGSQSTELMKQWIARYPQLHMCILAFKYILAQWRYNSNFKGGIGSYCLFVMIAAYIRDHPELE